MDPLTDKDILDTIKFLVAWISTVIGLVMAVKLFAREFGNRGKAIEKLEENDEKIERGFENLKSKIDKGETDKDILRRDVDRLQENYESLIERLIERHQTTRRTRG